MLNGKLFYYPEDASRSSRKSSVYDREGGICEYTLSQQRVKFSVHVTIYILYFYLGLLTADVARSGQRQVSFLKPHLITDTRPTSRKYVVNVFPNDITP